MIWTEENKTLTFLYAPEYREGELFKGKKISQIFKGEEVLKTEDDGPGPGWAGFEVEKAVIDKSAKLGGYFTPKYMRIRFDANGGEGSMKEQRTESFFYREAGTALQPNAFTRDGFRFIGWNTKEDGTGTSMEDGSVIAPKEDLTLYAQWEKTD